MLVTFPLPSLAASVLTIKGKRIWLAAAFVSAPFANLFLLAVLTSFATTRPVAFIIDVVRQILKVMLSALG